MALEKLGQQARAVEENWCAAWMTLGAVQAHPPTLVDDTPDFVRVYTPGAPEMLLNIVMRYASARPVEHDDIEQVIAPFLIEFQIASETTSSLLDVGSRLINSER